MTRLADLLTAASRRADALHATGDHAAGDVAQAKVEAIRATLDAVIGTLEEAGGCDRAVWLLREMRA